MGFYCSSCVCVFFFFNFFVLGSSCCCCCCWMGCDLCQNFGLHQKTSNEWTWSTTIAQKCDKILYHLSTEIQKTTGDVLSTNSVNHGATYQSCFKYNLSNYQPCVFTLKNPFHSHGAGFFQGFVEWKHPLVPGEMYPIEAARDIAGIRSQPLVQRLIQRVGPL